MVNIYDELRHKTAEAIRKACAEITAEYVDDKLFAFALCTDDDVMTLYSSVCTRNWVSEREDNYEAIGYIYTEWDQHSGDSHFDSISELVASLADNESDENDCDRRFEAFVLALEGCRDEGIFDDDTLLCCGSTDPSDHMEMLAMKAVDRLNQKEIADKFAEHLGYEEYRTNKG